jgi:hypothetical protein
MYSDQKKVTIKIDPLGRPTIEAHGFAGVGCEAATAPIEKALAGGNGVDVREFKPERYAEEQSEQARQSW